MGSSGAGSCPARDVLRQAAAVAGAGGAPELEEIGRGVLSALVCSALANMEQVPKLYVVIHHHRHGEDVYPVLSARRPTQDEMLALVGDKFETEENEWLELRGPFAGVPLLLPGSQVNASAAGPATGGDREEGVTR